MIDPRFAGIERLYGSGSGARLAAARVAVVGVGGVGSWAAEAFTRSGVGHLTLIDADEICVSNVNRQLHALGSTLGRSKVQVMAARMRDISPEVEIETIERFLTPATLDALLDRGFDLVLDACDAFRVKVEMVAWCRRRKLPLIVCGSAGGRTDPTQIRVRDLSRTEHDALLSLTRRKLRQAFHFPANPQRYFGVPAVYSLENVRYPQADGSVCGTRPAGGDSLRLGCAGGLGAAMHVTASFGLVAAGRALERLLRTPPAARPVSRPREQPARVGGGGVGERAG
ncbi:MAG TPA: tRNA threonylcarbamoyladenosine dehydratase [Rhodanobacteraceae bacterium]|nr:tRNA threonylcarbamoyladenosine dehydratase [Rhodanobacteraceae bacterium]